ncbi:hypothetical protein OAB09_04550 [Pelagibacteraceae bacterium]|nr:hypothetical protein [Pelagibacteraceae bacterium]
MKKLLVTVVLGLLWSGSAFAERFVLSNCDILRTIDIDIKKKIVKFNSNIGVWSGTHKIKSHKGSYVTTKELATNDYGINYFIINTLKGEITLVKVKDAYGDVKYKFKERKGSPKYCNLINGSLTRHGVARKEYEKLLVIKKSGNYVMDEKTLEKLIQAAKDFSERRITEAQFDQIKDDIL